MSEMSSSAPEKSGPAKKPVSPARNVIGLIVLVAVVVVGGLEVWAKFGYNSAVNALNDRMKDEDKGLMTLPEAETMIGKAPDDAGSDVQEGNFTFLKKNYTWKGLISSYTLSAYYTNKTAPALHHIEAGKEYTPEPRATPPLPEAGALPLPGMRPVDPSSQKVAKQSKKAKADDKKPAADEKAKADDKKPAADEKAKADDKKPAADEKAKADDKKPAADEKAKADDKKPAADEKAKTPDKGN